MLTEQQFTRTRRLALEVAGIELLDRHREVLARRSQRVGVLDSARLEALLGAAEEGEAAATKQFLSLLTTKFTGFFRHPRHFDLAVQHARRAAQHHSRARLWSAAAATGEEPYSLAMAAIEAFKRDNPPVTILATDVDVDALAVAQHGEYIELAVRALEPARRERFFTETVPGRRWSVTSGARRLVEFRAVNLVSPAWSVEGPFDVILCRNVLMYLKASHRCAVLERMEALLAPDGLLMLDPAEHLGESGHLFTPVDRGVYSRRQPSGPECS
jgi:chemotaxis protein methyltransferase CheR